MSGILFLFLICLRRGSFQLDTSFESGASDDYAIPPDAVSSTSVSFDSSVPSLLVRSSYLDSPTKMKGNESLEKTGYLTKLGGKLKTWRKRWFVLKNGVLTYWKSQVSITAYEVFTVFFYSC